jgi:hypothetical protein
MLISRRVGALVLAALAIIVYFALAPKKQHIPTPASHEGDITAINSEYNAASADAQYIYQQIFATGVATKDTLAVIVRQLSENAAGVANAQQAAADAAPDQRIPAELVLLILAGALLMATATPHRMAPTDPLPDVTSVPPIGAPDAGVSLGTPALSSTGYQRPIGANSE